MILLADANVLMHLDRVDGVRVLTMIAPTEVLDGVYDECQYPETLATAIISTGIRIVQSDTAWLVRAESLRRTHRAISLVDALCLVYAQDGGHTLLTNDGPLRQRCAEFGVQVRGTLGVIDLCAERGLVSDAELVSWLTRLAAPEHRLPAADLTRLMDKLRGQQTQLA